MTDEPRAVPDVDPRSVRVTLATPTEGPDLAHVVVSPASGDAGGALVDGQPVELALVRTDAIHAALTEGTGDGAARRPVIMLPPEPIAGRAAGQARREVIVDGWRIELTIEPERRASLRERAARGHAGLAHAGPTEVRTAIPGRVVGVSVVPGDTVVAGQQLLVVEAMKMQNELRAPRDGVVASVAAGVGRTIEVGDILLVLE
jgi:biotin carboxyl carrier protein